MSREHDTTKRAGFSDWGKAAQEIGNTALRRAIEQMDPGNRYGVNPHRAIIDRLNALELPHHAYLAMPCREFLENPANYLETLGDGDYYFVSIVPGIHLAHEQDAQAVISFVQESTERTPSLSDTELYISHNGATTMSGHIIVKPDDPPSAITAEFTIGNFNQFHRGFRAPEVVVQRDNSPRLMWEFRGDLASESDAWQTDEQFQCDDGSWMTHTQIAEHAYRAIAHIPHDGDTFLPGYYEVLLERRHESISPVFIEAITKSGNTQQPALLR